MKDANAALDEKIDAAIDRAEGFKRKYGRYTLEEAAAFISERTGENAKGLHNKLMEAAKSGDLARYWPFSSVKSSSPIVRDNEEYYWCELNDWLKENAPHLDCRFPQPIAEAIDSMAHEHGEQADASEPQKDAPVSPSKVGAGGTAEETEPRDDAVATDLKQSEGPAPVTADVIEEVFSMIQWGDRLSKVSKTKYQWLEPAVRHAGSPRPGDAKRFSIASVAVCLVLGPKKLSRNTAEAIIKNLPEWMPEWAEQREYLPDR